MSDAVMKLARGQDCTVRIPGICCHNPETVVLAHYRMAGLAGVGMKPHPLIGAHACHACHNEIDGRTRLSGLPRAAASSRPISSATSGMS